MLSSALFQRVWDLSDDVLYPEAVAFIQRLVKQLGCSPLPTTQVMGLLNIANAANYRELERFIKHQRERDWPEQKKDIGIFYTELEKYFATMRNKRVRNEFHLLSDNLSPVAANQEVDEIMAVLAHEFIQHFWAENGLMLLQKSSEPRSRKR
jgi:hypothetical protein